MCCEAYKGQAQRNLLLANHQVCRARQPFLLCYVVLIELS